MAANSSAQNTIVQNAGMPSTANEPSIQIVAAGDAMTHLRVVQASKRQGQSANFYYGSLFEDIKPYIEAADLAFANLETPMAKKAYRGRKPFVFNADTNLARSLKWAGFDVLSIANNHSLDQGLVGLRDTIKFLEDEKLSYVGAGTSHANAIAGKIFEIKDIKVGFIGFTRVGGESWRKVFKENRTWLNVADTDEEIISAVAALKAKCDVSIVSIHWGEEYRKTPLQWQRDLAQKIHNAGADLILGHHPHVLQTIEWGTSKEGRKTLTAFSLGNFLSNQSRNYTNQSKKSDDGRPRDGVLLNVNLTKNGIQRASAIPLWTNNDLGSKGELHVVPIESELERLNSDLADLDVNDAQDKQDASQIKTQIQLLTQRRAIIMKTLGKSFMPPASTAETPRAPASRNMHK